MKSEFEPYLTLYSFSEELEQADTYSRDVMLSDSVKLHSTVKLSY